MGALGVWRAQISRAFVADRSEISSRVSRVIQALDSASDRWRLISPGQEREADASARPDQPCVVTHRRDVARRLLQLRVFVAEQGEFYSSVVRYRRGYCTFASAIGLHNSRQQYLRNGARPHDILFRPSCRLPRSS
jgi:hypothetical protein